MAAAALLCAVSPQGWAQYGSPDAVADILGDAFAVFGGTSVRYDTNFFKRSQDPAPETQRVGYIGLRADVPFSQQRITGEVTRTGYRHNHFTDFDYSATEYRAALLWTLTRRLTGSIRADQRESQTPFYYATLPEKNIRTSTNRSFDLDGDIGRGIHALFGLLRQEQVSTQPVANINQPDFRYYRWEGGLRYGSSLGNSVALFYRNGRGEYFHRDLDPNVLVDNRYRQREVELRTGWLVSARSTVTGRIAWLDRRHEHFPQLDSSGIAYDFGWQWKPTDKLGLNLTAKRDLIPYFDLHTSHRVDKTLSASARWQATTRFSVNGSYNYTRSDYLGASNTIVDGQREDRFNIFDISGAWAASRNLTLSAGFQQQRRQSNQSQFAFDAKIYRANAEITF